MSHVISPETQSSTSPSLLGTPEKAAFFYPAFQINGQSFEAYNTKLICAYSTTTGNAVEKTKT